MSSFKNRHSSIFVVLLLLLVACAREPSVIREFHQVDLKSTPLFYYSCIGTLNEAPVGFVEPWNRSALEQMGVHRITLYSKGGKNPDDTLEKITFDYSGDWKKLSYEGYKFDEAPEAWTSGRISLPQSQTKEGEILFSRHFGINKELKTIVRPTKDGFLLLRWKAGDHYDSTWVVGSFTEPEAIVSKIGKSVFSVEIFLPEGSSKRDIIRNFKRLPVSAKTLGTAHCSVIFTQSGKPLRAFLLNNEFSQVAKIREWTYTKENNIASYQEWMGTALIRDMSWHYGKSQLPEYTTIDRNTYFYHYE